MHLLEGLVPAGPCFGSRPGERLPLLNNEIDRFVQLTLLNDGFGYPDPLDPVFEVTICDLTRSFHGCWSEFLLLMRRGVVFLCLLCSRTRRIDGLAALVFDIDAALQGLRTFLQF